MKTSNLFLTLIASILLSGFIPVSANQMQLTFSNLKGTGCYSTQPIGCSEDKTSTPLEATLFKNAKGEVKLLMSGLEYSRLPSPSKDASIFIGMDADEKNGWAVVELLTIDSVNKKVSIVGTRSTRIFEKPIYQLMGDVSFD